MGFLDIAHETEDELYTRITYLLDKLPADIEIEEALIKERARELGISDAIESALCAMRLVNNTPPGELGAATWEKPMPLVAPPPPPFRAEWLPGVFGQYAAALAEFTQTPLDLSALLLLGAVSTASMGKWEIHAAWKEPIQLYICVSMATGERKSPVFKSIFAPLYQWEQAELLRLKPEIERSRTSRALKESQLRKAISKGDEAEALRLTDELGQIKEVKPPRLTAADATGEVIARLMSECGQIAVVAPEGGIFDIIAGRYSNGIPNMDIYLNGFSSEAVSVDRVGRDPLIIPRATMVMVLATQPEVVKSVFDNGSMVARGLAGRFLWAQPPSMAGHRKIDVQPLPHSLIEEYEQRMLSLLNKRRPPEPTPITLTNEAARCFAQWRTEVERRLLDDLKSLKEWGWADKLTGLTLRIAATLAIMAEEASINAQQLLSAVEISRWAIEHAKAVSFGMCSSDDLPRQLLEVICSSGWHEFTQREIHKKVERRKAFKTSAQLYRVLCELEEAGYIRKAPLTPAEEQRRVCRWLVNPYAYPDKQSGKAEVIEI